MLVHFIRSVQRVAKRVNPPNSIGRDAFIMIGKHIPKADSAGTILMLFEVLRGTVDIKRAKDLLPKFDCDEKEYIGWDRATS